MSHEHEFDRRHRQPRASELADDLAPNRATPSSQLDAPARPIASGIVMRKARDANGVAEGADAAVANASSSTGFALPETLMRKFESSLAADLSSVRLHTGAPSADAATAVGAKAYTLGQDIHFGAGQYDPSSSSGQHLLAHEVAHTVQQQGLSPSRQHKLDVSSPGDHLELDADRAADAMIVGSPVAVMAGAGVQRQIYRDTAKAAAPASDDKQWAGDARGKITQLQNAVTAATTAVNADASAAAAALHAARTTCEHYETRFNAARDNFTSHVKEAIEHQKEFEEMLESSLEAVLAASTLGGAELAHLLTETEHILKVFNGIQGVMGNGAPGIKRLNGEVSVAPSGVSWEQHLDRALDTLTHYIQQNVSLAEIAKSCIDSLRLLSAVLEGTAPDHARQSAAGIAADKLVAGSDSARTQLGAIGSSLAGPAQKFATGIAADLAARGGDDQHKLEQDIAIRWLGSQKTNANGTTMTGVGGRGSSEIHAAREYLNQLGVIGKSSRTGIDPGLWDTDVDDDNIVARARAESGAAALVGSTAEWQGGHVVNGSVAAGHVKVGSEAWNATGAAAHTDASMGTSTPGLHAEPGGAVRITGYKIAPVTPQVTNAASALKQKLMHDLVTLDVVALGPGVLADPHGPTIGPRGGGE
jgi:hypothetical protein